MSLIVEFRGGVGANGIPEIVILSEAKDLHFVLGH